MTDKLRAAAEMALEALKTFEKISSHEHLHIYETITVPEAVKALEQALAEPDNDADCDEPEEWDRPPMRDYFAAKAMQGFAASVDIWESVDDMAKGAYDWADAMIKERGE